MPFEETLLFGEVGLEVAAREAGHHLEQNRDVIFRFPRGAGALDSEPIEVFTDARQRALVQEAGEVIGGIGKQVAAAEPDEQVEEFLADAAIVRRRRASK